MKRTYKDYINDIMTAITNISEFIKEMDYNDFTKDKKTEFAVIRALEIIGEATKNIPESMRDKYKEVPWKSMTGMRDKLIHAYFGVRLELIWNTASELLPPFKKVFQQISLELKSIVAIFFFRISSIRRTLSLESLLLAAIRSI